MADAPADAEARRAVAPVVCYPAEALPLRDPATFPALLDDLTEIDSVTVPPRDARAIRVPAGHLLGIFCPGGSQVGDLNLFAAADLSERFFSGKTRALHGSHVTTGDRLWSGVPHLRPMATIVRDTLDWYGTDPHGGRVHDVIGTRCDPYTARLLSGRDYHRTCHSNLTRALAAFAALPLAKAEPLVHDVLNVFMCTGFTRDEGRYFMKASPARAGDRLDLLAEFDLVAVLSACPGGDCGSEHSSDAATCHPLQMQVLRPAVAAGGAPPEPSAYDRSHGT